MGPGVPALSCAITSYGPTPHRPPSRVAPVNSSVTASSASVRSPICPLVTHGSRKYTHAPSPVSSSGHTSGPSTSVQTSIAKPPRHGIEQLSKPIGAPE